MATLLIAWGLGTLTADAASRPNTSKGGNMDDRRAITQLGFLADLGSRRTP